MSDWLINYGSWCLAPFGLLGMWAAGRKRSWGWLLSLLTQCLWAGYAVGTSQYGFLLGTTAYAGIYLRNWLRWRHENEPVDPLPRTVELLRELNTMELEKDRDGNAEQPWWYMRDHFTEVLGTRFEDELPEEDETDD